MSLSDLNNELSNVQNLNLPYARAIVKQLCDSKEKLDKSNEFILITLGNSKLLQQNLLNEYNRELLLLQDSGKNNLIELLNKNISDCNKIINYLDQKINSIINM